MWRPEGEAGDYAGGRQRHCMLLLLGQDRFLLSQLQQLHDRSSCFSCDYCQLDSGIFRSPTIT
jgi:hypothetical protein